MADTLSTLEWAPILDQADVALTPAGYSAVSSDTAVATIGVGTAGVIAVVGQTAGTADITTTRNSDGATHTLTATVTAGSAGEFVTHLGAPQPKG